MVPRHPRFFANLSTAVVVCKCTRQSFGIRVWICCLRWGLCLDCCLQPDNTLDGDNRCFSFFPIFFQNLPHLRIICTIYLKSSISWIRHAYRPDTLSLCDLFANHCSRRGRSFLLLSLFASSPRCRSCDDALLLQMDMNNLLLLLNTPPLWHSPTYMDRCAPTLLRIHISYSPTSAQACFSMSICAWSISYGKWW